MSPSSGYKTLAKLIEEGYFRLILTTNFDFMLEEALKKRKLVLNKDYFICIVGEGKERILFYFIFSIFSNHLIMKFQFRAVFLVRLLSDNIGQPFLLGSYSCSIQLDCSTHSLD